jgi:glyoxylase-like metal-dependent hydrolase (beta-lactamase superfamily II)
MSTRLHHVNGGWLHAPPNPPACCHCLLLEDPAGLVLIDIGIGLHDVRDPVARVGQVAIDFAGFRFDEADTAVRQLGRLGFALGDVRHVVLTHADPDHAGGLADFPAAAVHVSAEELDAVRSSGHPRYRPPQFDHGPRWVPHGPSARQWFGLEAREVPLGLSVEVLLVPLFGHTAGHCGVAVGRAGRWVLHVGDAYYLRAELATDDHPVSALAAAQAVDDGRRVESLRHLRRLARDHAAEIELFGYHDVSEFPQPPGRRPA